MKQKLRILVGIVCVLVALFVAWLASGSSYPKLLIGRAWILTRRVPVAVEIDGHRLERVLCFATARTSQRLPERLILGVGTLQGVSRHDFLIVGLAHQRLFHPNPGDRYNRVLHNGWLLQSDAGASGVDLADPVKGGDVAPGFRRSGNTVSFSIASTAGLPGGRWNVTIDPNRI